MGLVCDQQIVLTGIDRFTRSGQGFTEQPQWSLSLQKIDAGDQTGIMCPRVHVDSTATTQITHQAGIDDPEFEPELVPHLIPPLNLQRGRDNNQDLSRTVSDNQFQGHHSRFDRLTEADVIRDQQIDPGHLNGPHHRVKLVVFDLNATSERRLNILHIGSRRGTPPNSIQKRIQFLRSIKAARIGKSDLFNNTCTRFNLPDNLQFFAQTVIFNRRKRQKVLR